MKVSICGKGGSGKSTISALIARSLKDMGFRVLLVDADESNFGLHGLMGVSAPLNLMDSLGGKKEFKQKMKPGFPGTQGDELFPGRLSIEEMPAECIAEADGIKLLTIGKIHDFGEGCACPMGVLSKMMLSKYDVGENEIVVIDTEAGIEHFGRRVDAECDMILGIVDPSFESFMLAEKMQGMAEKAGTEIFFELNRVSDRVEKTMRDNLLKGKIIAAIPESEAIFMESLNGKKLTTSLPEIDAISRSIRDFRKKMG